MSKAKADELRQLVNKQIGSDVLTFASDEKHRVKYIPIGLLPLDILLKGGVPRGRFMMIQGDWSTLKSYIGYRAIAMCQAEGGVAAVIDTEHSFDKDWAASCGVDVEALIIHHPETGEEAIDVAETLTYGGIDLILFDSVSATLPQAEKDKRMHGENVQPGRQAALFSIACRKLTTANSGRTAFIWINQFRENIGITFGPREKATGGRALPYYMSYILEIRKVGKITKDEKLYTGEKWQNSKKQIGQKFKAELIKSKLNKPFREVWFDWSLVDSEIDIVGFLFSEGVTCGVIGQKGSSWSYGNIKVVGKDKFKARIASDKALQDRISRDVLVAHSVDVPDTKPARKAVAKKTVSKKKTLRKAG